MNTRLPKTFTRGFVVSAFCLAIAMAFAASPACAQGLGKRLFGNQGGGQRIIEEIIRNSTGQDNNNQDDQHGNNNNNNNWGNNVNNNNIPGNQLPVQGTLVINNPAKNGGAVSFTLQGRLYTLAAGQVQEIPIGRGVIVFDRGGQFGNARYTLTNGAYEFNVTPDKGWDVHSKMYTITLDNTASNQEFGYLLEGQVGKVGAGQSLQLKSGRPMTIVFDRGDGGAPATKQLSEGTYKIGVDPASNLLDIFTADGAVLTGKPVVQQPVQQTTQTTTQPAPVAQPSGGLNW